MIENTAFNGVVIMTWTKNDLESLAREAFGDAKLVIVAKPGGVTVGVGDSSPEITQLRIASPDVLELFLQELACRLSNNLATVADAQQFRMTAWLVKAGFLAPQAGE